MIIFKRKSYTKYDDTDNLKRMKDSDILAERRREPSVTPGMVAGSTAAGALAGATIGGITGAFTRNKVAGSSRWSSMKRGAGKGALLTGAITGGLALYNRNKSSKENQFYNDRLEYAKRQALRRERKDWKQNMTGREGYSY